MAGVNVSTNRYATSNIIVAPTIAEGAMFTTIGAAITYASANSITQIFIKPGTYTENITDPGGICYASYCSDQLGNVKIVGKITQTGAINSTWKNIYFKTNSDNALSIGGSGGNQSVFDNCFFFCGSTGIAINNSSASPVFRNCTFSQRTASTAHFSITSAGQPTFNYCTFLNDSGGADGTNTVAAGIVEMNYCRLTVQYTTSSSGSYLWTQCYRLTSGNSTVLTTAGTGTTYIINCTLQSGTSATISVGSGTTVVAYGLNIISSNSNPITGAGTFTSSPVIFGSTGYGINVTSTTLNNLVANGISFDKGTNLLSQYSTSTYSPAINGSVSNPTVGYSAQQGNYTKIGNMCFVDYNIATSSISSGSGNLRVTLPVTARASTTTHGAVNFNKLTVGARSYITAFVNGGTNYAIFLGVTTGADAYTYQISDIASGSGFQVYGSLQIPI